MQLTLSETQLKSYMESTSRLNLWEGSVRSGKTFACALRFIKFLVEGPKGDCVIVGRTDRSIKRNIITILQELIGDDLVYKSGLGEITLWGRMIYVVGANDERAEGKIRGATFAGALVDELTLIPESFFQMLLSRLSIEGAQLFATTNPDSPFHWLKTKFIDRQDELDMKNFKFKIHDNPSLSESYKKNLHNEYLGLWALRYIKGEWCLSQGAVYDFFDPNYHVISYPPGNATYYIVGVDYGTQNPCVFVLIGVNNSLYPNMWLEKEYYYDSKSVNRQKTDSEYAHDFMSFVAGYNVKANYIDPSALSFKVELNRLGIRNLIDADNDVLSGIRFMGQLISNGTYKVCCECSNSIKEYSSYLWDEKAAQRGIDQPLKVHDHCCDAQRYALYTHFFDKMSGGMTEYEAEELERRYRVRL